MGTMPFHIEKGVLGLRMDYLTRSQAVRNHVVQRLQAGEDPFVVITNISVPNVPVINVLTDRKADFVSKLDALLLADPNPPDGEHERRAGRRYWDDQGLLRAANNDATGNRDRFAQYWMQRRAQVTDALRQVLIAALTSGKEHIDYWWECSLPEGSDPTVVLWENTGAAHVFFTTDHGPVEPVNTGTRAPTDDDPPGFTA